MDLEYEGEGSIHPVSDPPESDRAVLAWKPPAGITHTIEWCEEMSAWRVRLKANSHGETLYVRDGDLSVAYLDMALSRFLAQAEGFARVGREFERIFAKGKRKAKGDDNPCES